MSCSTRKICIQPESCRPRRSVQPFYMFRIDSAADHIRLHYVGLRFAAVEWLERTGRLPCRIRRLVPGNLPRAILIARSNLPPRPIEGGRRLNRRRRQPVCDTAVQSNKADVVLKSMSGSMSDSHTSGLQCPSFAATNYHRLVFNTFVGIVLDFESTLGLWVSVVVGRRQRAGKEDSWSCKGAANEKWRKKRTQIKFP
jgi:hypothetical protein